MKVKSESEVTQSCPTLSDSTDCSLPGSSVHGIFQARVLEWGAIAFSNWEVQTDANQGREGPETREEQERNSSAASGQVLIPSGDTQTGSLSCFADTESPTRWEKLTVRRPQERGAQTCWNQKVEDEDSRLPHHPPVRGKSTPTLNHGSTTPHYPHQVGTHVVLRASTRPGPLCLTKP